MSIVLLFLKLAEKNMSAMILPEVSVDIHHGYVDLSLGLVQLLDEHVGHEEAAQEEESVHSEQAGHDELHLQGAVRLQGEGLIGYLYSYD